MPTLIRPRLNVDNDLYVHSLQDLLLAERALGPLEKRMASAASSADLKQSFEEQHELSLKHAEGLEEILANLQQKSQGTANVALRGLVKRAEACLSIQAGGNAHDILLIAVNRSVRHYQLALYGTALDHALRYQDHDTTRFLGICLEEERKMDRELVYLGDYQINIQPRHTASTKSFSPVLFRPRDQVRVLAA